MRDYTVYAPKRGDIRSRKRKQIRDGLLALLVAIDFIISLLGIAYFENTDDPKGIFIAGAVLIVSLVTVIFINIREERN